MDMQRASEHGLTFVCFINVSCGYLLVTDNTVHSSLPLDLLNACLGQPWAHCILPPRLLLLNSESRIEAKGRNVVGKGFQHASNFASVAQSQGQKNS